MTLLTRHIEAGWHEVEWGTRFIAEKFHDQPGATSTVLREEGTSQEDLRKRLDLRESQLSNEQDIVVYPQDRVSDSQHSANQILGTAPAPSQDGVVVPDPDPNADTEYMASDEEISAGHEASAAVLEAGAATPEPEPNVQDAGAKTPGALSDEERAKLRSDEDELEDGKIDGIAEPIPAEQLIG